MYLEMRKGDGSIRWLVWGYATSSSDVLWSMCPDAFTRTNQKTWGLEKEERVLRLSKDRWMDLDAVGFGETYQYLNRPRWEWGVQLCMLFWLSLIHGCPQGWRDGVTRFGSIHTFSASNALWDVLVRCLFSVSCEVRVMCTGPCPLNDPVLRWKSCCCHLESLHWARGSAFCILY